MYKVGHATTNEGRQGKVTLTDQDLVLDMMETTPEDLFAAAYAACYYSALNGVKAARNIECEHRVKVTVGVDETQAAKPLYVKIQVAFDGLDRQTAERLAQYGDQVCRYSTAVEGNIKKEVELIKY